MKKRFLAMFLVFVMVFALMPTAAFAADSDFTIENGVLKKYNGPGGAVTIPNSVTSIERYAFRFTGLTSVTIPDSVTSINAPVFGYCSNLTAIQVDENNSAYTSIDGVLFTKDKKTLVAYPSGKQGTYTIPSGVTRIEWCAFDGCMGLTSVTIPSSATSIGRRAGEAAFYDCRNLTAIQTDSGNAEYTSIDGVLFTKDKKTLVAYPSGRQGAYTIPNSVTSIGGFSFNNCKGLTSVTIGNSVTNIGNAAFEGCTGLTSVTIPNSVTNIVAVAFLGCTGLTSVTIPSSVTSIGEGTFSHCTSLKDIYYGGSEAQWKAIKIDEMGDFRDDLTDVTIHYNSTGPDQSQQPATPENPSTPSTLPTVEEIPATGTAVARTQSVLLDDKTVSFQYYAVKNAQGNETNYVKVRDLAQALNGTAAQFNVGWDGKISITSNTAYEAVGGEGSTPYSGDQPYTAVSDTPVRFNGSDVNLTSFQLKDDAGSGYTYFKLRDLGQLLNFNVTWNGSSIVVESDKPYTG